MRVIFTITFFVLALGVSGQIIKGVVNDNLNPLPFANITLLSKKIGTCSDENGFFSLDIKGNTADTLLISSIGFEPKKFAVSNLLHSKKSTFCLKEIAYSLDSVVVKGKARVVKNKQIHKLGNLKRTKLKGSFSGVVGSQIVVYVKNSVAKSGYLKQVILYFDRDNGFPLIDIRLRIYKYDKVLNIPTIDLLRDNLIFKPKKRKMVIDVSDYHINMPIEGICIGVEWIDTKNIMKGRNTTVAPALCWNFIPNTPKITWTNYRDRRWRTATFNSPKGIGNARFGVVFVSEE